MMTSYTGLAEMRHLGVHPVRARRFSDLDPAIDAAIADEALRAGDWAPLDDVVTWMRSWFTPDQWPTHADRLVRTLKHRRPVSRRRSSAGSARR